MIIETLALLNGRIERCYISIEDSHIASISRSTRGSARRIEGLAIPGLIEIYSLIRDETETEEMLKAGITDAIVYGYNGGSLIDIGIRSDSLDIPPREAYGYIVREEKQIRKLYEVYGSTRIAIIGTHYSASSLALSADALGHETIIIAPRFSSHGRVAISLEDLFVLERRREAFKAINSREPIITFGRLYKKAAPVLFSLILQGYASRKLMKYMQDARNKLGLRRGLMPGMRANIVILKKKRGSYRGIKTYFEVDKVFIGGEMIYDGGSILGRPKIEIIRGRRLNDTQAKVLR